MRGWMICFLMTAAAYVLQLFPYTGIFMMLLGGPLWSVILINLGFGLMVRDAMTGALPRIALAFPLLWFGGYTIAAAASHWQVHQFNADLAQANADERIAFDPSSQDVLIDMQSSGDSELTADSLVGSFSIDRVYEFTHGFRPGEDTVRVRSLVQSPCPGNSGVGVDKDDVWQRPSDRSGHTRFGFQTTSALCLHKLAAKPSRPTITIRAAKPVGRYGDPEWSQDIVISSPTGHTIRLKSGWRRPLTWLPQPILGCALDSGAPAWRCFAGFNREKLYSSEKDLTPQSPNNVVAAALGLHKATIRERYPNAGWH